MQSLPSSPTVIVLAAGRGERYLASGGTTHKLDALLAGTPILKRVLDAVADAGLPVHVVGPQGDNSGMGDSIARGVRATPGAAGWLILPGDLALISAASIRRVASALADHAVVVPQYQGKRGHPVGFSASCYDALAGLAGDTGAASVVRAQRLVGRVLDLSVDDIGVVLDVDSLEDLKAAEHALRFL